jgi:hypothetical protein
MHGDVRRVGERLRHRSWITDSVNLTLGMPALTVVIRLAAAEKPSHGVNVQAGRF